MSDMLLLQCFACEICCRMNAHMLMGFPVFSRGITLNMPTTWIDLKSRCTVSVVLTDDGILHWSLPKLFHLSCIYIVPADMLTEILGICLVFWTETHNSAVPRFMFSYLSGTYMSWKLYLFSLIFTQHIFVSCHWTRMHVLWFLEYSADL